MKHAAMCYVPSFDNSGTVLGVFNPKYNAWAFPGGKVEVGEKTDAAALRELTEETGICSWRRYEWIYSATGSADPSYMVHTYFVDTVVKPMTMEPGNEVRWCLPDEFCASPTFGPWYQKFFRGRFWRAAPRG